jgi:TPR repeat protein
MKYMFKILAISFILVSTLTLRADISKEQCKILFDEYSYQQAISFCTLAANSGDSASQTMLGEIYDQSGKSEQVAFWWNKAAEAGYQPARNLLALKYYYGGTVLGAEKGWKQDYSKAFEMWMEDARKGVATSQFMVGVMYQKGYGIDKDLAESWFWLKVALNKGYKLSTDVLIEISREISAEERSKGEEKLKKYKALNG